MDVLMGIVLDLQSLWPVANTYEPISKTCERWPLLYPVCPLLSSYHILTINYHSNPLTGMKLEKAYKYLADVKEHKQAIPFRRFSGGVGRASQAKQFGATLGRWPEKSVRFILGLLKNAESNADAKNIELGDLFIKNIVVNQAPVRLFLPLLFLCIRF